MSSNKNLTSKNWPSLFRAKSGPHASGSSSSSSRPAEAPKVHEERNPEPKPRWNPRPEQIRILEDLFNSGMVNPSRDEIKRIKNRLLPYGNVGDANVFYWFQNRKSRTKQKLARTNSGSRSQAVANASAAVTAEKSTNPTKEEAMAPSAPISGAAAPYIMQQQSFVPGESSSALASTAAATTELGYAAMANQYQSFQYQAMHGTGSMVNPDVSYTNMLSSNPQASVTVNMNGHTFDVPPAPLDVRSLFGERAAIFDVTTNQLLPMNEAGVTMWPVMNGHSYLVIDTTGFPNI
uniref:HD transcription factor n=1 Tax=Gnetum gnemon TaxID=3382 RepID=S6D0S4_GNEGN|nr:HD transcription factor [Gnetum gnemon]